MNRFLLLVLVSALLFSYSCKPGNQAVNTDVTASFNNGLTADEKAGGVLTPEILWKFRRLGQFTFHPMEPQFYILLPI